jgi:hypothetical protein
MPNLAETDQREDCRRVFIRGFIDIGIKAELLNDRAIFHKAEVDIAVSYIKR